jgi:transposase-like protein
MPIPETHCRLASRKRQAEMNILSNEKQVQIISALVEGNSVRATARMVGVEHKTVMRVLLRVGAKCERLMNVVVQHKENNICQQLPICNDYLS